MKIFVLLLPPGLALLLLAAHFYRAGLWWLALAALALGALLAVPRAWAARVIQLALVAGSVEWLRTLAVFAAEGGRNLSPRRRPGPNFAPHATWVPACAGTTACAVLNGNETRAIRHQVRTSALRFQNV